MKICMLYSKSTLRFDVLEQGLCIFSLTTLKTAGKKNLFILYFSLERKVKKYFQVIALQLEDTDALVLQLCTLQRYWFAVLILLPEKNNCTSGGKQSLAFIIALHFHMYIPREGNSGCRSQFYSSHLSFNLQTFPTYFAKSTVK